MTERANGSMGRTAADFWLRMMPTTGGVAEAVYGSLMRIQRRWSYRYQYRAIGGVEMPHRNLLVMERTYYKYMYLKHG